MYELGASYVLMLGADGGAVWRLPAAAPPLLVVAAGAALLLIALGRRVAPGWGEGILASALGGLSLIVILNREGSAALAPGHLPATLLIGAAMFQVLALLRGSLPRPAEGADDGRHIFSWSAAVCGLLAGGLILRQLVDGQLPAWPANARLVWSAAAAGGLSLAAAALSGKAGLAVGAAGLAVLNATLWRDELQPAFIERFPAAYQTLSAALALVLLVLVVVAGWVGRRFNSRFAPQRLANRGRTPAGPLLLVALLALLAGLLALVANRHWSSVTFGFVAALAAFGVGHLRWLSIGAPLGLALIATALSLAGGLLMSDRVAGYALGLAIASLYFRWLSRFWKQQLLDGQPWTTTGRMIPWAQRGGSAAGLAAAVFAASLTLAPRPEVSWLAVILLILVLLLLALRHVTADAQVEPMTHGVAGAALGAVALLCGLLVHDAGGPAFWPPTALAAGGTVLALLVAMPIGSARPGAVVIGLLAGVLPMVVWLSALARGLDGQVMMAGMLTAGAMAAALSARASGARSAASPA